MLPAATSIPVSRQRPGESFWFTLLPDSQTVYVNFRGYRQLGEHAERLMAFLATSGATRLIVDLRQNGGGDFVEGRRHVVEPLRRDTTFNRKGRLYVLVGRRTFSAAMVNAIDFRKRTNAILVPQRAVRELQGTFSVGVLKPDSTVEIRPVKAGARVGNEWVVDTGLVAGTVIVVEGMQKVRPGVKVRATQAPPDSARVTPASDTSTRH